MEVWLKCERQEELEILRADANRFDDLRELCLRVAGQSILKADQYRSGPIELAQLLADIALALQLAVGHVVRETKLLAPHEEAEIRFVIEYDHGDVAALARDLAKDLVEAWLLGGGVGANAVSEMKTVFQELQSVADRTATPRDANALIKAARELGIPRYRMDREPFDPIEGDFRLRPNGLLRFGHGRHRLTVDGVFCIERLPHLHPMVRHRATRLDWLKKSGLPFFDSKAQTCLGASRARRLFGRLNAPVWIEPEAADGLIQAMAITDEAQLVEAVHHQLGGHGELLIGESPPGRRLDILWINGIVMGVAGSRQSALPDKTPELAEDPRCGAVCARLAEILGAGCLGVALVDSPQGWKVMDFDLNPRLDYFISDAERLQAAALSLMRWLFPDNSKGRIPIIAVTGTNGKTTTCHMIEAILIEAGYRTGMATSLGSRVAGEWISELEDGFLPGHLAVLSDQQVDVAILESTRGGARSVGLGFDHCSLSACLNVAADHLNDVLGLRTVEELAEVKQWIAHRAENGMVLNYDDSSARAMIDEAVGCPVTVVSTERGAKDLVRVLPSAAAFCTLESHRDRSWLVLSDSVETRPLVAVDDIPMTLKGLAKHNVSNAAHAAALCASLGVDDVYIAKGLSALKPDFDSVPGRLNLHSVGEFRVLYDYAHNPHGVAAVMDFVDRLPVRGMRRINFSVSGLRSDDFAREVASLVAGHFDDYICTNYAAIHHRSPGEVPSILRSELLDRGVADSQIRIIEKADEAILASLASAQPGDLIVFLVGKSLRQQWKLVQTFGKVSPVDLATIGSAPSPDRNV